MNSAETNGGFHPSIQKDSLGRIYFPTVAGVAVVDPKLVDLNEVPPPVYIEGLRTDEGELPFNSSIELSHNTPFLEINYTAVSFTDPGKVQFKYIMRGYDDTWIEVGTQRSALYSKIPPGEYTFQVLAVNEDGVWNAEGASLGIVVVPPFWQTNWFYTLSAFFIIGLGGFIYYQKVQQLKKDNERKQRFTERLIESEEQERQRIARELHDSLGQQILVIKNRAELAQKFVGMPDKLDEQLSEILESAVTSIADVRTISHGLMPVHLENFGLTEAINNLYTEIQETTSIDWSFHVDRIDHVITEEKEINFFRIIQEGINNIVKHSKASEAYIIIRKHKSGIKARLWDNGIGFDVKNKMEKGGLGLSGMKERIKILNGTIDVQSSREEGTSITIEIPVEEWAKK
jgi:signal transduction histidine kinase